MNEEPEEKVRRSKRDQPEVKYFESDKPEPGDTQLEEETRAWAIEMQKRYRGKSR